jgi:hypothetical protein
VGELNSREEMSKQGEKKGEESIVFELSSHPFLSFPLSLPLFTPLSSSLFSSLSPLSSSIYSSLFSSFLLSFSPLFSPLLGVHQQPNVL